ncbi:hypothetical protein VTO42DRAFT_2813 [Malbranchea cinnamomea]
MALSTAPSYQALVELEKGLPGSPREQLREAARIIGVDLDCQGDGQHFTTVHTVSAPKEEWVLRWLMKKLKSAQNGGVDYRVDKYSWILLRALFTRIPPKPLAVILCDNKFLSILKEALESLAQMIANRDNTATQGSKEGSPYTETPKTSRKRKRTVDEGDEVATVPTTSPWIDVLQALLESVYQIVSLQSQIPANQAAICSQIKIVLKGETELAAQILGSTMRYASNALLETEKSKRLGSVVLAQRLLPALQSSVAVWESRLNQDDDNDNFVSHALASALRFLMNLRNIPDSADKQALIHGVERLVVLHVILPLRDLFFSLEPTPVTTTDSYINSDQVRLISDELDSRFPPEIKGELLPVLFNIAIRSVPRDTFRRQINEAPWLETLFVVLAARLGFPISGEISEGINHDEIELLEKLVQVAIDRKLGISLKTLSEYASRFSGLISEGAAAVHWRLVAQLIHINVDIFLPNSGYAQSRVLLEKLIAQIRSECLQFSPLNTDTGDIIKSRITVPLLRGFSGARDLDTFVKIWKNELVSLESARSSGKDSYLYSIWEDDNLLKTYGDLVTTTFPLGHTKGQLESLSSGLNVDERPSDPSEIYVRIILLDAFLMSNPRQDEGFIDAYLFDKIFNAICSMATSKERTHWHWRLWRILQHLFNKFPGSLVQFPSNLTLSLLPAAVKALQSFLRNPGKKNSDISQCRAALCSFSFVAFVLAKANIPGGDGHLNTLAPSLEKPLRSVSRSTEAAWNGRVEKVESPQTVAIGFLIILLAYPSAVAKLASENRRLLFKTIISTLADLPTGQTHIGSIEISGSKNLRAQLAEVWNGFVSPDWVLAAAPAVYDLVSVICMQFTENKDMRLLLLGSLLRIPARLIPPHLRVTVLDNLQSIIIQRQHGRDVDLSILSLMKRLVELPKSSAQIITDWEALWKIADSISLDDQEEAFPLFQTFYQLHKAIVERIMISSESNRRDYIQKTLDKLFLLSKSSSSIPDYGSISHYMFCLSLNWVHLNREEINDNVRVTKINSLREQTFQTTVSKLESLLGQTKKRPDDLDKTVLLGILGTLDALSDLSCGNKDIRKAIQKLAGYLNREDHRQYLDKIFKPRCIAWLKPGPKIRPEIVNCAPAFPVENLRATQQSSFIHEIRQQVSLMPSKKLIKLVREIREASFSDEHASYQLILVGIAVLAFDPIESRESPEAGELSSLFTVLSNSLSGFTSIEPFCLATECIDLLLRTHPKCVSQWNIDNLLAAISVATSHSGPRIPRECAGAVFSRLCRLLGTLFGLYRKKLSGRFHLILPPLQRLLRCLFTRDSREAKASPLHSELPPWMGSMDTTPLNADHAGQYCRLLTSLCDPTVSAVQLQRGSQTNQALSDSTKKVKSLAGQYLQYLVMEYAGSQLRGHLPPEMKAVLMPGIYSVLDVMSRSTMRAMNAAMDSSSRAIFKGLYDDYVRFGKWNHD